MKYACMVLAFLAMAWPGTAQTEADSLQLNGMLRAQFMLQSGNLNQVGGNGMALLNATRKQWSGTLSTAYQYVRVEGFTVVNDWWSYALAKRSYTRRVHPIGMAYYGFANSFGINSATVGGAGVGLQLLAASPTKFVRLNTIGGYMHFDYSTAEDATGAVANTFLNASWPVGKHTILGWQTHAYWVPAFEDVYGFQNSVQLALPLTKRLNFTVSHLLVYSQRVDAGKEQLNTTLLAGLMLRPPAP